MTPNPSRSRPAIRSLAFRWGVLIGLAWTACSTGDFHFTPEQDDAVIQEVESAFEAGPDGARLALCEDRERSDAWSSPGDCQEAHVVRGGGRGLDHSEGEASGIGCGGCPFAVVAYVRGTWTGAPFAEPVEVEGEVRLGDLYDVHEIFDQPWVVDLRCTGQSPACSGIAGELGADGRLELTVYVDYDNPNGEKVILQASEQAVCE